jgi:hypothetical protein
LQQLQPHAQPQPLQQQQLQQPQPGQHAAADAAMYREMRQDLCDLDAKAAAGFTRGSAPRHKAFYAALRSVLGQVLEEKTEASRHTRLLAAHQWYVKHKPRPRPADMNMAAAMAASLSVQGPTEAAEAAASSNVAAGTSSPASKKALQQQQQQPFRVLGVGQQLSSSGCEAPHSPAGGAAGEQRQACKSRSAR